MNDLTLLVLTAAVLALVGYGLTGPGRAKARLLRGDETGASGIETAIITAVLAGIAIALTAVIVKRIDGQSKCIAGGTEDCTQSVPQ